MIIEKDLYDRILRVMPIPCVDLHVTDSSGRVLLVKRKNEPMMHHWWFPGGRVLFKETRQQAATRKLQEECGLKPVFVREVGTYDLILPLPGEGEISHGITTLFHINVGDETAVTVDSQSASAEWREPEAWLTEDLHDFVRSHITHENM